MPTEFKKPKIVNPPDNKNNIWCPDCDWHMSDSYNNRRRLGEHLCNTHYKEIAVPKGQEPKDLEPEEIDDLQQSVNEVKEWLNE